ncbi:MAG TPA: GNAT family N-acetyltransferase [Ramlibacter sp.]|nr:GNAT family N-acetyltransferase [Ramlibacter sp.]
MPVRAPERIVTGRLEMRMFRLEDHEPYARMCADPGVMRYIGAGEVSTPDISWRSIAGMLGHWDLLGYGQWAVVRRDDGVLLGRAGYFDPYGWPGFELGYLFAKEYWGKGYAREACTEALRIAVEELKKERVISLIRPQNAASIKLAKSLGGEFEEEIEFLGGKAQVYLYRSGKN